MERLYLSVMEVFANRIMKLNDEVKIPEKNASENSQLAQSIQLSQKNIRKIN